MTQICPMLDLYLNTNYFQYRRDFYRQKHGCAMRLPVFSIVDNHRALLSFSGTFSIHWFRYVNDTWVKIKSGELGHSQPTLTSIHSPPLIRSWVAWAAA